jgi:vacuolar-type H+-ATPase subunit H
MKSLPRPTAPHLAPLRQTPLDGAESSILSLHEAERAAEDTIARAHTLALQKIADARSRAASEREQALERSREFANDACAKAAKESEGQIDEIGAETEHQIGELRRRAERNRNHAVRMLIAEIIP